jgi:hypothetical protein
MKSFAFKFITSYLGDDLDETEGLEAKQIITAANIGLGIKAKTPSQFRDAYAKENDFEPGSIGVELWDAFAGRDKKPSFTLIYFGFVDGGVLLRADTSTSANLMLWQHGFERIDDDRPAPDAEALTKAYFAARAR